MLAAAWGPSARLEATRCRRKRLGLGDSTRSRKRVTARTHTTTGSCQAPNARVGWVADVDRLWGRRTPESPGPSWKRSPAARWRWRRGVRWMHRRGGHPFRVLCLSLFGHAGLAHEGLHPSASRHAPGGGIHRQEDCFGIRRIWTRFRSTNAFLTDTVDCADCQLLLRHRGDATHAAAGLPTTLRLHCCWSLLPRLESRNLV